MLRNRRGTSRRPSRLSLWRRPYDDAIQKLNEVIGLDATFVQAHALLAEACLRAGDYPLAAEELRSHQNLFLSGELAAVSGDRPRALRALKEMEDSFRRDHINGTDYMIARLLALLGESDASIAWLEKSVTLHDGNVAMLNVDPGFDSLRGQPRFSALLRRLMLVSATQHRQPTTENRERLKASAAATR